MGYQSFSYVVLLTIPYFITTGSGSRHPNRLPRPLQPSHAKSPLGPLAYPPRNPPSPSIAHPNKHSRNPGISEKAHFQKFREHSQTAPGEARPPKPSKLSETNQKCMDCHKRSAQNNSRERSTNRHKAEKEHGSENTSTAEPQRGLVSD